MAYVLQLDENNEERLNKLLTVSNPKEVIAKAIDCFKNPDIKAFLSNKKNKQYMILNPKTNKMVNFGDMDYEDYTKHKTQNDEKHI